MKYKYYWNEPKFNSVYSRDNLFEKKDEVYVVNLDEYEWLATQWIALYVNCDNVTYFESFEVEHFMKNIIKFIGNKNIIASIYRTQAYSYINLFFSKKCEKNDKTILKYF